MDMNSPLGKKILALVREADYAHAGEQEAIDFVFKDISQDSKRTLLDVGCGRGGTAQYVQSHGWGKVLGVDIDDASIEYAKKTYPQIEFMVADAGCLAQNLLPRQFDIMYLFNVLYAFSDHLRLLQQMRRVSHQSGELIIFDYLLKAHTKENFPFPEWSPLDFSKVESLFTAAGWCVVKKEDISDLYEKWYRGLVARIEKTSSVIIACAGKQWFDFVHAYYSKMRDSIEQGMLGGALIYAKPL